jgi:hypothetical protein
MRAGADQLGGSLAGKLSSNASSTLSAGFSLASCRSARWRRRCPTVLGDLGVKGRFMMDPG